jgi:hypothetical protein
MTLFVVALCAVVAPGTIHAQENAPEWGPTDLSVGPASPKRLAAAPPLVTLAPAGEAELQPIAAWNLAGNRPLRNGTERPLPKAHLVVLPHKAANTAPEAFAGGVLAYAEDDRSVVWTVSLEAENAWRLRLRLGNVRLPEGAKMWVYGRGGEFVGPFGTELVGPDGTLWTPSVAGPEISLEVLIPESAWKRGDNPALTLESVSEIFRLERGGTPSTLSDQASKDYSCLVDAACATTSDFAQIEATRKAVAHLQFVDGGSTYICTGTLVNDKVQGTWVPYMLTANHCFSSQGAASTLEAYFDYIQSPCGGSAPPLGSLPRSNGSTLLATSTTSDFSFVRLNSLPSGRYLLGWNTAEPSIGETLYRVSHPDGLPAAYSTTTKATFPFDACGFSSSDFHFSTMEIGAIMGGSSGGSALNSSGQIVGQLYGFCGPNIEDNCDEDNYQVDGKFASAYPLIRQYIDDSGGGTEECEQDLENGVVCLRDGRFEFTAEWTDFSNPPVTRPLIWTPVGGINATGGFQNNPSGIQIVMRVADGCSLTDTWWVWLGGFTDAGWNITVRDTVTGIEKTYTRQRQGGSFPTTMRDWSTFTCD